MSHLHQAASEGNLQQLKELLEKGSPLEVCNQLGRTPLHTAVDHQHLEAATLLFDAGAELNALERNVKMGEVQSPLSLACWHGNPAMVRLLLDRGAEVNVSWKMRNRFPPVAIPLNAAIQAGADLKLIEMLLDAGADMNAFLKVNRTLLDEAISCGKKRGITTLQKAGAKRFKELMRDNPDMVPNPSTPLEAIQQGNLEKLKLFIAKGLELNKVPANRSTFLMQAALEGHREVFHYLIAAGADVKLANPGAWDLLTCAAYGGNLELVRELLDQGCAPDGINSEPELAEVLKRKLKPRTGNHPHWHTPLMSASWQGHLEIVKLLIERGADVHATNASQTALKWAKSMKHKQIVTLLEQAGATNFSKDAAKVKVKDLGSEPASPGFTQAVGLLRDLTGRDPSPWKKRKGVLQLFIGPDSLRRIAERYQISPPKNSDFDAKQSLLFRLQQEIHGLGALLISHEADGKRYLLFPTTDNEVVLAACGTNGINHGQTNEDVIYWFREQARNHPWKMTGCGFDFVSGRFGLPVTDPASLLKRMVEFCPDLEDGEYSADERLRQFEANGAFFFWWD